MNGTEIYYFSGTGNSLYVARELKKRIAESSLVPIASLLEQDTIETKSETVGLVFPLHGMTIPIPITKFLKKVNLKSAGYIFAVVTRAGSKCLGFSRMDKILAGKGKHLNSTFIINMPDNDPKFKNWEIPAKKKIAQLESEALVRLDFIHKTIMSRGEFREKDSGIGFTYIYPVNFLLERLVLLGMAYAEYDGAKDYFYSDAKCSGCGICMKVCPSRKIKLVDKRPVWQKNVKCYMCYACLNYCPMESVQIKSKWWMKSYTEKNGRYSHPFATEGDIAGQKERISSTK